MHLPTGLLVGSFVFRNEGDGCLTSKYHHFGSPTGPFTEASKVKSKPPSIIDEFSGIYETTWLEEFNNHEYSDLEIKPNHPNSNIFDVIWYNPQNKSEHYFEGTAMLFGDLLVGAYWNI